MTLPATETGPRTYKVEELAEILQLRPATVRANARSGAWPYLRFGERTMRFTEAHLATILATSEVEPPAPQPMRRRTRRPTM
ncbi:hypothetical protein [Arthrobacter sp. efr-133-TYG-120]|uniref:hypothetical protein n=1 Tax=Arthrobacter sp. efr-133-TYG-120 TaxID=3040280 RepID=UPI00254A7D16|nr:hypothetical protein [Arthrobacter sp. efr-133-TYG-120]